jgi:uncharacterized protein YbjT (DUF2867 family)
MILVTGATGNVGLELIKKLFDRSLPVRAFVRDRSRARAIALPGIELVEGDFARPETVARALDGVEQLFLLMPSSAEVEQRQRIFVDAARKARVKHIVKLSQFGADAGAHGRFQRYHAGVEHHIRKSRIPYTFLRPNLFMQSLLSFRSSIASQGIFYAPAGNARVSIIDVRDIASVAAAALVRSEHENQTYELTGPEALTHAEMAGEFSEAFGKTVKYVDVPPETMLQTLLDLRIPRWQAEGVVEDYDHYRRGEAAAITSAVRDVTQQPATRFSQFAADYARQFLGKAAGA